MSADSRRRLGAYALMLASGAAALGYQVVWTQQLSLVLGHETAAVLAVVAAFFGGLALGALAFGPRIERSARAAAWYAGCELAIGAWSLVLALAAQPAANALLAAAGAEPGAFRQWAVAFFGSFVLLLPATAAMGATLPAIERALAAWREQGGSLAGLYAANTAGAVLGVLAAAFWAVPALGLVRSAALCAFLNAACAAAAWLLWRHSSSGVTTMVPPDPSSEGSPLATLAATGCLGIAYEVLVVRVLSQLAENTVYTFALLLTVYLIGTAAGAAAYQRWAAAGAVTDAGRALRDRLLVALAAACALGTALLWPAAGWKAAIAQALGGGMAGALAAEAALAVAAFGLPTCVMGALFSHLSGQVIARGAGLGRALGVNTLGAAAAPALFGVLLLPALGSKAALLVVAAGYLALVSWSAWRRAPLAAAGGGVVAALLALGFAAPPLAFVDRPEGGQVLSYAEGAMAAVSVTEDAQGVRVLRIDNRQQEGSNVTLAADARQALLPLLLHPAPQRALFLGLGTGVTASSATWDRGVRVDAVELLPEVIGASRLFTADVGGAPERLNLRAADARRWVRAAPERYDLIVADNFHPARSGSGALYTVEHFRAVRARLAEGGVFCQWLPLHQIDLATLRSVVASFLAAYPHAALLLAHNSLSTPVIGLLGRADDGRFDRGALRARLAGGDWMRSPAELGIGDEFALAGSVVAGPSALVAFARGAVLNTDDRPWVAYHAPAATYAPEATPAERLLALLGELGAGAQPDAAEWLQGADPAWSARLDAYARARVAYLHAGLHVQPMADPRRMLAQVQQPLLAVLRTSADFRPAYEPLVALAGALAQSDPAAARALLQQLADLQPAWPEAGELLAKLPAP